MPFNFKMKKLLIISSHPIQYNAPLFKLLSERKKIEVKVFYSWGQAKSKVYDPGFGKEREWDIPLLEGYNYEFIENVSKVPGSHHFKGIINPTLFNKIDTFDPDAILVFGWSFQSHLKVLRHYSGKKKILFRGDSNLIDEQKGFSVKKIIRRLFLRWVYSHIDTALYVGTANRDYFLANGVGNKKLLFAPHAIDNERFKNQTPVNFRETINVDKDAIVFLFAGKLEQKKNPELLIRAFTEIKNKNCYLLIVGDGVLEKELKNLISVQTDNVKSRVRLLPFQNQRNMPDVYKAADVFCLPSQGPGETWGLAINEAMACSLAILVSDKCGCAVDLVKDNYNGFIVKANDLENLKAKMNYLAENKHIVQAMQKASLEIIENWSLNNVCVAIEQSF
jgi:glycosyltransferase involved in cell wall biosynthesis